MVTMGTTAVSGGVAALGEHVGNAVGVGVCWEVTVIGGKTDGTQGQGAACPPPCAGTGLDKKVLSHGPLEQTETPGHFQAGEPTPAPTGTRNTSCTVRTSTGRPSRQARERCAWLAQSSPEGSSWFRGVTSPVAAHACRVGARTASAYQAAFCDDGAGPGFPQASEDCDCPLEHHVGSEIHTPVLQMYLPFVYSQCYSLTFY